MAQQNLCTQASLSLLTETISRIMFTAVLTCIFISADALAAGELVLEKGALFSKDQPFVKNLGQGSSAKYLSLSLSYEPFKKLREQVEKVLTEESKTKIELKNRGEAHVTVVTPPEFTDSLAAQLSIEKVHEMAEALKMQESTALEPICVGRGEAKIDGKLEYTYFLVVKAPKLLEVRKSLQEKAKGFDADHFYPHVTLGFTKQDLHEQQGVIKNEKSCWRKVALQQ